MARSKNEDSKEFSVFLDITPSSPLEVNRNFGGICRLHLQGLRVSLQPASYRFLALLTPKPWRWCRHIAPKSRFTASEPHGVISQKIELFITTGERTSNPTTQAVIAYGLIHGRCNVFLTWCRHACPAPRPMFRSQFVNLTLLSEPHRCCRHRIFYFNLITFRVRVIMTAAMNTRRVTYVHFK
jgi:hypothetical protein